MQIFRSGIKANTGATAEMGAKEGVSVGAEENKRRKVKVCQE